MQVISKTRQDNEVTDIIVVIYAEDKTELLWPIEPNVVCHDNQLYRYGLCRKQN